MISIGICSNKPLKINECFFFHNYISFTVSSVKLKTRMYLLIQQVSQFYESYSRCILEYVAQGAHVCMCMSVYECVCVCARTCICSFVALAMYYCTKLISFYFHPASPKIDAQ